MAPSSPHHHHHGQQGTFVEHPVHASFFVLILLLAYALSGFEYVENNFADLSSKAASGKEVHWTSFDRVLSEKPKRWYQPATKEEVMEILRLAVQESTPVKVVGSGHSWSPVGLTDGFLMNLDRYNKIVSLDTTTKQVRVQAGIRIRDLSEHLALHNLALSNTGVLNRQSLAGALATGTHGTGIHFPVMSSSIVAIELITSGGQVLELTKNHQNHTLAELFEAATISLGALGVVTQVTLQCIDHFSIIKRGRLSTFAETLGDLVALDSLAHSHDHVMLWWVPYTSKVQVLEANRTAYGGQTYQIKPAFKLLDVLRWPLKHALGLLQMRLLSASAYLSSQFHARHVPLFNQWLIAPVFNGPCYLMGDGEVLIKQGFQGLLIPDHPDSYRETEYFLSKSGFDKAFPELLSFLEEKREVVGANLVIQIRWTRSDDLWLSPFRIQEPYAMAVALLRKGLDVEAYFQGAEGIFLRHGGRPHWGKLHYLGYDELVHLYDEKWRRFTELRRLVDPTDTFLNSHLRHLCSPTDAAHARRRSEAAGGGVSRD